MDDSKKTLKIPEETKVFLEGLLSEGGMSNLDSQVHEDMIQELFLRLDTFMTGTIVDSLEQQDIESFIKLAETGANQEEIQKFLQEKIPNAQEVFTNAMLSFRDLYLGKEEKGTNTTEASSSI